MSRKGKKVAALEEKLQLLRSVTKSNAGNNTSILVDASKYMRELKVDKAAAASSKADSNTQVSVSSVDLVDSKNSNSRARGGFRINVSMERTRPGLLVSVLEALEEIGLDVLDADVSCADDAPFHLQALGGSGHQQGTTINEQMVRQTVLQAINKCMDHDEEDGA